MSHVTNGELLEIGMLLPVFFNETIMFRLVSCGVRDEIKDYHLSLSSMDIVKGD
jgi:hypothetical protein